jgi:hypothetical protein
MKTIFIIFQFFIFVSFKIYIIDALADSTKYLERITDSDKFYICLFNPSENNESNYLVDRFSAVTKRVEQFLHKLPIEIGFVRVLLCFRNFKINP